MIQLAIPGRDPISLTTLVSDVNGTLAIDGRLIEAVIPLFKEISDALEVYLLTADTLGTAAQIAERLNAKIHRLTPGNEIQQKAEFLQQFGCEHCITLGQGANDEEMLRQAGLGIAVLSKEGSAPATLQAADIIAPDIVSALELIIHPKRIVATLRK
jgi:P-type E1-E2 ATPase